MIERETESESSDMSEMDESKETASIPTSLLAGQMVKPGDVVRLRVVSVDEDEVTVSYDHAEADDEGSDALAAKLESKPEPSEEEETTI